MDTSLLISIGGTGGVIGAALARRYGLPVVQIQNPRMSLGRFDLVIANTHDRLSGPNVLVTRNALHGVTPQSLLSARQTWESRLRADDRPLLSVLTGGANGRFSFNEQDAAAIAAELVSFQKHNAYQIVLTPSRRTGQAALAVLRNTLEPAGIRVITGTGPDNPYMGMLACADMIAVTTDSVSMISEAAATSVPVAVIPLPGRSARIGRFIETLQESGRIRPFSAQMTPWPITPLDDTPSVAREMRQRLQL